jgi:hypothetical protein
MNNPYQVVGRGSAKFVDGQFLSVGWQPVFYPLSEAEKLKFTMLVNSKEQRAGRLLTYSELINLSNEVSSA